LDFAAGVVYLFAGDSEFGPMKRILEDSPVQGYQLFRYHGGEDQQRSFDSTWGKFQRFLTATAR